MKKTKSRNPRTKLPLKEWTDEILGSFKMVPRDPDRIHVILKRLEAIWSKRPDLRLGQLILNVFGSPGLYGVEDEYLLTQMEMFYAYGPMVVKLPKRWKDVPALAPIGIGKIQWSNLPKEPRGKKVKKTFKGEGISYGYPSDNNW